MLSGEGTLPRRCRGVPVPMWFNEDTSAQFERMVLRPTDVILASYPRSGTHWVYNAIRLLTLTGSGPAPGDQPMALAESNVCSLEELLGRERGEPRVVVTHAPAQWLPALMGRSGSGKLVYVCRDPRDALVSNYHFESVPCRDGWEGCVERFLAPRDTSPDEWGSWFEQVGSYEQMVASMPPERACVVEYEEMAHSMPVALAKLARVLGAEAEARLKAHREFIYECLGFRTMKADPSFASFLRRGKAGGWRDRLSTEDAHRIVEAAEARLPRERSTIGYCSWRVAVDGALALGIGEAEDEGDREGSEGREGSAKSRNKGSGGRATGKEPGFFVGGVPAAAHTEPVEERSRERDRGMEMELSPPGSSEGPDGYPRGEPFLPSLPDIRHGYEDEANCSTALEDGGGCWEHDGGFDFG